MPDDRKPPIRRKTNPYGIDLSGEARDRYVPKHSTPELAAPHEVAEEHTDSHNLYEKYQRAKNHSAMLKLHAEKLDTLDRGVTELRVDAARKNERFDTLIDETFRQSRDLAAIARMHAASAAKRLDTDTELEAHRVKWWRKVWFKVIAAAVGVAAAGALAYLKGCT